MELVEGFELRKLSFIWKGIVAYCIKNNRGWRCFGQVSKSTLAMVGGVHFGLIIGPL